MKTDWKLTLDFVVQLMAAEKKARQEIEDLKNHIRKMQEAERKEKRKLADEDAIRKLKKNDETIHELQTNLSAQKQVRLKLFPYSTNKLMSYIVQL